MSIWDKSMGIGRRGRWLMGRLLMGGGLHFDVDMELE